MKSVKIFFALFLLTIWGGLAAATSFSATSFDVTNITVNNNTLTLKAVISGDSALKAGGFSLTFPADRLAFAGAEDVDGVILNADVSGTTLTAGYMVTGQDVKRLELKLNFSINGQGPYIIAANSAAFRDDLAGCSGSRPGIYVTSGVTSGIDSPVMWSVPDPVANLFVYIPRVSEITDVSVEVGGQDVLEPVLAFSAWYVDPVMDVAYLVLPGLEAPTGSYPVTLTVEYGEGSSTATADVVVR